MKSFSAVPFFDHQPVFGTAIHQGASVEYPEHIFLSLGKHSYSNILKMSPPKTGSFQIKNSDIFHISAQNIDSGYSLELPHRGSSNEYPQCMF